ncbi:MAG: zinc ribbon domain-containing protein [Gordonia paraffinivorans]
MGVPMQCCADCAHVRFPPAVLCPRCHAIAAHIVDTHTGIVAEITTQMTEPPLRLASLATDRGPVVLAAVPDGTRVGDTLPLSTDQTSRGRDVAVVPTPTFTEDS